MLEMRSITVASDTREGVLSLVKIGETSVLGVKVPLAGVKVEIFALTKTGKRGRRVSETVFEEINPTMARMVMRQIDDTNPHVPTDNDVKSFFNRIAVLLM